jgi:glycosyltransferase involved in cell wall biosynthesis
MKDLTLVIPAKNEWLSLPKVLEKLKKYNYQIIIILHRTDTKTIKSIKKYKHKIIKQKNDGYGDAIIKGINSVKTKYLCIFNADGSFNPNDLSVMVKKIKLGSDFVFASRYLKKGGSDDDTIITYIGNKIFTWIGKIFFRIKISDILFTFIAGNTVKFKRLNLLYNDFRLCVEIPVKIKWNNFKYTSIPSFERPRIAGVKNVNEIKDGFLILWALFRLYLKNDKKYLQQQ